MKDILVIVDSPEKGKIFENFFDGKAEIIVCFTPILRPAHKTITSGQEAKVVYSFEPLPNGAEVLSKIDSFTGAEIFIALDDDPRSDYLGWTISSYIKQKGPGAKSVKRLRLPGLKADEIREAINFAAEVEDAQGVNFYTRSYFDSYLSGHLLRLIGTNKGPGNLPLSYNCLSTLFLLADREMEINMFASAMKWQVKAELKSGSALLGGRLEEVYDGTADGFFKDEEQARSAVQKFSQEKFTVDEVEAEDLMLEPPAPYQLVELLQDAMSLDIGPLELLGIVRKLYHGVEVEGTVKGLISSFYSLANADVDSWLMQLKSQAVKLFGENNLGEGVEPDDGMIFPLYPEIKGDSLTGVLNEKEVKIYELIRCRAIASQMKGAFGENIRLEVSGGKESIFSALLPSISSKGFLEVYTRGYEKFVSLTPVSPPQKGDTLELVLLTPEQISGVSTEYYTFESIFADLVDFSISADPVNIIMLQGMVNSGYASISKDGGIIPGENINQVLTIINRAFPRMQGINLSAYIEQTIAEALTGRKGLDFALKQFDQTLTLHGNALVKPKPKAPPTLKPRARRASSIIKTVSETPLPGSEKEEAKVEQPVVQDEVGAVEEGKAVEATQEQRKDAAEEITKEAAPLSEEAITQEERGEESLADSDMDLKEPVAQEETAEELQDEIDDTQAFMPDLGEEQAFISEDEEEKDEWPSELKSVFENILKGEDKAAEKTDAPVALEQDDKIIETDQEKECQVCGKDMLLKQDRFGKFWSCSGFPTCRHSEAFDAKGGDSMACPMCEEGSIVNKRTPSGKTFYVCIEPDCEFMAWSKPHYISCQVCDSPYLVEKKNLKGKIQLKCPKAGCNYAQNLKGGIINAEDDSPAAAPKKRKVRIRRVPKGTASKSSGGKKKVRLVRRKK